LHRFFTVFSTHALDEVLKLLITAMKYQVDQLAGEALALLSTVFPTSFKEWNHAHTSTHTLRVTGLDSLSSLLKLIDLAYSHADSALQALLPAVYLQLCIHHKVSSLWDIKPSDRVLRSFTVGRGLLLAKFISRDVVWCKRHPEHRCIGWTSTLRMEVLKSATEGVVKPLFLTRGQLKQSLAAIAPATGGESSCHVCRDGYANNLKSAQKEAWNDLPKTFGVADNWAQLVALQEKGTQVSFYPDSRA
jgi:hypothetical protein